MSSNQEILVNSLEFLEPYAGPSFRSSMEKFRVAFGSVPTNLHLQQFSLEGHLYNYLTHGGLTKQRIALHSSINDPKQIDHILDSRFYHRRRILLGAKSTIGDLARRIETDWHIADFGKVDKTGVQLLAEIKQVRLLSNLYFLINFTPEILSGKRREWM
ncbi:unnamed protein product [Gongylonema pulchrum]|uniref:Uncharacterized protein n=1 Tax=Gongylonema pulchrum TaxID=637853 RepID=A0A3P7NUX8_9BILA|nr:unnamed protein product [Gongylonema pulchrum]